MNLIQFISSAILRPTIILIIIPLFAVLQLFSPLWYFELLWQTIEAIILLLSGFLLFTLPLGYMLHSTVLPTEKYFRLKGPENAIIEFEYVKKILIVAAFLLLILLISLNIKNAYNIILFRDEFVIIIFINLFVTLTAFLKIIFQIAKKEFRLYSAKAYFIIALRQDDYYKKIRSFNSGLDSYNKYLQRRLNFEIKGLKKVYSKFLFTHTTEKQEIIKSVQESLEDKDKLRLARHLSTFSGIPETELFVSQSLLQQLKTIGVFLAAAIPIILSIIQLARH